MSGNARTDHASSLNPARSCHTCCTSRLSPFARPRSARRSALLQACASSLSVDESWCSGSAVFRAVAALPRPRRVVGQEVKVAISWHRLRRRHSAVPMVLVNPTHNHSSLDVSALAPGWLSLLLASEITATGRATTNSNRSASADTTNEHRDPAVGCRRAADCRSQLFQSLEVTTALLSTFGPVRGLESVQRCLAKGSCDHLSRLRRR